MELQEDGPDNHSCLAFLGFCDKNSNEDCAILQEKIFECEPDDLPRVWDVNGEQYNYIQLECQHKFHASSIALHFLTNSMRCPVCREGCDNAMKLTSIPSELRSAFARKVACIPQADDNSRVIHVHLDEAAVNRDWILMANVLFQHADNRHSTSIIPTRIQVFDMDVSTMPAFIEPSTRENFKRFRLQNHFSRNLNLALQQNLTRRVVSIHFLLYHPLLINVDFVSRALHLKDLPSDINHNIQLKFENLIGAYITPLSSADIQAVPNCYRPAPYQVIMNMEILLQCISSQIHENIARLSNGIGLP